MGVSKSSSVSGNRIDARDVFLGMILLKALTGDWKISSRDNDFSSLLAMSIGSRVVARFGEVKSIISIELREVGCFIGDEVKSIDSVERGKLGALR